MSKKKRRYGIKKEWKPINYSRTNCHHLLWQKRHWDKGWSKILREFPYCKIEIPKDTLHAFIHENMGEIPVPDGEYCRMAFECIRSWLDGGYIHEDDTIEKRIETLIVCFKHNSPNTTKALQKQLDIIRTYKGG